MAADPVSAITSLVNTVTSWFLDEDGYRQFQKRQALAAKKEACRRALMDNDWDLLKRLTDELRELAAKP